MLPPQVQQQMLAAAVASGQFPNMEAASQAMAQSMMAAAAFQQAGMMPPPPFMNVPPHLQQQQPSQLQQPQQQPPVGLPQGQVPNQPQSQPDSQQGKAQSAGRPASQPLSVDRFPPIGVGIEETAKPQINQPQQQQQYHQQHQQHQYHQQQYRNNNRGYNHQQQRAQRRDYYQQQLQQQLEQMTPEEREKFTIRQNKVSKITRCSGFMGPKDKDFVTRFQLSQIVTEDPYNEDFYYQVYQIVKSSLGGATNDVNSIAQKYLDQSGHRLGGRSKRVDIALQRMQQQVSKAVTVAKERGQRSSGLSKEGALGRVSFGTGKQPRQQIIIKKEEASSEEKDDALPKEYKFPRSSRSFQLSIIEDIYTQVLKLESMERENQAYQTTELWKSLHLNDKIKTSTDEINPFISILSFDKTMKVFQRLFHFLSKEEQEQIIELIFTHLQKIDIVLKSSYKNYADSNYSIPKNVNDKIELFQSTIMRALVIYIGDTNFQQILSILNEIISNNNVLFLCTTKIGCSLLTVIISRLELIKQEYSKNLSAQDLSNWSLVYDKLFQGLEGRLASIFPPFFSNDESRKVVNEETNKNDGYIWQFLATLSLGGLLNHQRIIVDEIRNEIFGVMSLSKTTKEEGDVVKAAVLLENLNLFLNVMGLNATEDDISELASSEA
ncbi:unnamed protein product [Ambrosiozyma monospora]|uniref:Unnamed protein product n=1 Tax=Ambrosiozyma monospora TaxID=43982 RepID=A0ACB5SYG4_AMBMO|nr:unnamed protein product [Ambrosiozyma monospora]